jgi:4-amino-4-deoxy-L-arabinose transferase-like glycosyltransferase
VTGWRTAVRQRTAWAHVAAVAIMLYGGLLRLDAFTGKYGELRSPAWAHVVTSDVAPLAAWVRPDVQWGREAKPFVGGDPINYLAFAREMTWFYQAHVREPVFLALTRGGLWALDGQDAAVGLASAIGSTLAVFGTYLLGAALLSPAAGLLAALLLAIEYDVITWAPDGWRDDTFTATVVFAAWALLRLRTHLSVPNALLAGALCGVASLTRVTALAFILPAVCWFVLDGGAADRRARMRYAALTLLALAIVLGPYLISCAIVTGDPFYAINYHTSYYRFAEGRPIDTPMSAAEYLRTKFASRPIATVDTGMNGLFVQPFVTKWHGFEPWMPGIGQPLGWLSLVGLAALPFGAAGRLLLVILLGSLLPYIFTWNLGGGGEWRFTMHAYPFYLVAACSAVVAAIRAVTGRLTAGAWPDGTTAAALVRRAGAVAAVAALGAATYFGAPWFVVRESIAAGESTSVETGPRDPVFFRRGWSDSRADGVSVRISEGASSTVQIPLPDQGPYDVVLRVDPVLPGRQQRLNVLFNGHFVAALRLAWDPARMGSYRIPIREGIAREGDNELTLVPATLVPAGAAGPRLSWLPPDAQVGVRLWYVRVIPVG